VYRYGASGYPTQSHGATNYFVDVVFVDGGGPSVASTSPPAGATTVDVNASLAVVFSEAVAAGTVSIELRDAGGGLVPVTVDQSGSTSIAVTPDSPFAGAATYTASVLAAEDQSGNALEAPHTWSFTTVDPASVVTLFGSQVPSTAAASDPSAIEVGMRFEVTEQVDALGIRFYRGPGNSGPHVGHLWTEAGAQLAEVSFTPGGPDGWQHAPLSTPLPLAPGQVYVVSYHAPAGNYAVDGAFFGGGDVSNGPIVGPESTSSDPNGLYLYGGGFPTSSYNASNYWVDVQVQTFGGGT
jgi:hypothetical protein